MHQGQAGTEQLGISRCPQLTAQELTQSRGPSPASGFSEALLRTKAAHPGAQEPRNREEPLTTENQDTFRFLSASASVFSNILYS